jgi:hypothetical protein
MMQSPSAAGSGRVTRPLVAAALVLLAIAALLPVFTVALRRGGPPASELVVSGEISADPHAPGVDTMVTLSEVSDRLTSCATGGDITDQECTGVLYFWSPEMPLSRMGIAEIASAARTLNLALDVVPSAELYPSAATTSDAASMLANALVAAGASVHTPAILLHRAGVLDESAIVGYKTAEAYASLIAERLRRSFARPSAAGTVPDDRTASASSRALVAAASGAPSDAASPSSPSSISWRDFSISGTPGAYFRWVPGRNAVAYEAAGRIHLLDLETGDIATAPGFVDFVPTPDGRFFVTPARRRALEFYDADQVFEAARAGRGATVPPFYTDPEMTDQYPSVGILSSETRGRETRIVYRVLTSWFDNVVFRDYEVTSRNGRPTVRPLGAPVPACGSYQFSIPIMSQSGREVAGRDEATATTKIFALADDGGCRELADVRLPTGKVAWNPDGRRVAFAIPEGVVRDGSGTVGRGGAGDGTAGIFVFDRRDGSVTQVEASVNARRLNFPEFVGTDRVLFLVPREAPGGSSRFRLVCCMP